MSRLDRRKDAGYLAYVRGHATVLGWAWVPGDPYAAPVPLGTTDEDSCDDWEPTVAHHVRMGQGGGMGLKPTDYRSLPLTDAEHKKLHQHGEAYFWLGAGVDPWAAMAVLLGRVLREPVPAESRNWRGVFEALERTAVERNG